jgi:aminocarboxymuconate-semialdehyde decarboxylase
MANVLTVHSCGRPASDSRRLPDRRRRDGATTIDLHCHVLTPSVEELVLNVPERPGVPVRELSPAVQRTMAYNHLLLQGIYQPKLTDIAVRLADMDAMGVDIQVISPSPTQYHYWAGPDISRKIVSQQNEYIAELCAAHPQRLIGFGAVSLQHPEIAASQARHAVREWGLRGFEISTLVNGIDVDDLRFRPFWEAMEELGAVVLLHPLGTTLGNRVDEYYLSNVIGQPLETSISLSRMIFGGHFDRFRKLKLCAVHGGGYLPLYTSRSEHAYSVRPEARGCELSPREYLRRIWFDTVVYDPAHLRRLIDVVGVDRVVIGTDYPFDMGESDPLALIEAVEGLTHDEQIMILGENARSLLQL